jgi:ribonucleoside-triphosphate reductase
MSKEWSNLGKIVFKRTYARKDNGHPENLQQAATRTIMGNVRGKNVPESEIQALLKLAIENKAGPAGRGWWFSGAPAHEKIGGAALNNCWYFNSSNWELFVIAQDLLMLGGGVGLSVEHKFVSKLPRIKKDVVITHQLTKDANFIVPDSREGWCELLYRTLEAYFVTGKGFTFSTICVRGAGEPIKGFGGTASGPIDLVQLIINIGKILSPRAGRHARPIDCADIMCAIGAMVVAGNVRRSAIIIIGDAWDKEYLVAKRWDLGTLPPYRDKANFSVVCEDIEDLHPSFWKTYEHGEPFGLVNRKNIRKYGRMGEIKPCNDEGVNPCAEATLENGEPCNLMEMALCNMESEDEFISAARLMQRYAKRVTLEKYHHPVSQDVVRRNRRTGNGITGCLASPLFNPVTLDKAYAAIQDEDEKYSTELGIGRSIRTTLIKPSGTRAKAMDCMGYEGIHAPISRYMIQRIRFSSTDLLLPDLKAAGHYMEPVRRLDGTIDANTMVVDFYVQAPQGTPVADEDWDTWKQLDVVKMAQKHWADQSVSVTVYYKKEEIPQIKAWLAENLQYLKTISFLLHTGHGFVQAPKEAITKEQFEKLSSKIKPIDIDKIDMESQILDSLECEGGMCPMK